jgi:predicted transcriptional regulator
MSRKLLEMAAELVQAQALNRPMSTDEIVASLTNVFGALMSMRKSEGDGRASNEGVLVESVRPADEVPLKMEPKDSIQDNEVICLECGLAMVQLTNRHLKHHGLNLKEYRKKWGFPAKQSLSSKHLSKVRSKLAKKRGLPENLIKAREAKRLEREKAQSESIQPSPVKPGTEEKKRVRRKK